MATWNGEPYPGFFKSVCDAKFLTELVTIDNKWLPSHEEECDFAKLNCEVLTTIHEEKRFPTKEEFQKFVLEALPTDNLWENLWGTVSFTDDEDFGFVTSEKIYFGTASGTSPAAGDTTITTYGEPVKWDGISWKDFIQDEEIKKEFQPSALMSTKGVMERNFDNPLI